MKFCTALVVVLLSTVAAQAQWQSSHVISGKPLQLVFTNVTNPDCTSRGYVSVRVIQAPEHGRVTVSKAHDFPRFHASNVRSRCNVRRVAGVAVRYVSTRGYTGPDTVMLEAISPTGRAMQRTYSIQVR